MPNPYRFIKSHLHARLFFIALFCWTSIVLLLVLQITPTSLLLQAEMPHATHTLHQFDTVEHNGNDTYRWSRPNAALVLDGFWARPLLLTLRMTSPRPPSAPPAHMQLTRGDWRSNTFPLHQGWRRYHLLLPASQQAQVIAFDLPPFTPADNDARRLGFALSDLAIALPATAGWRFPSPLHLALVLPLPLLFVIVVAGRWQRRQQRHDWLALLIIAHLVLAGTTLATLYPLTWDYLLPLLWLLWLLLAAKHHLPALATRLHRVLIRVEGETLEQKNISPSPRMPSSPVPFSLGAKWYSVAPRARTRGAGFGVRAWPGEKPVKSTPMRAENTLLSARDRFGMRAFPGKQPVTPTLMPPSLFSPPSLLILIAYLALIFFLPFPQGMHPTNGDEPHYLLLAHSLVYDHDVDLRNNYQQQDYLSFYPTPGIDWHTITHLREGRISSHIMIGLPLLIAPAYWLAGRIGVLVLLSLLVWLATNTLSRLLHHYHTAPLAIGGILFCALSYPLVIYSQQIFPETIAFAIVAFVLYHTLRPEHPTSPRLHALAVGSALAFLPHLHYKLTLTAAMLSLFFLWKNRRNWQTTLSWSLPPLLLSGVLFIAWIYTLFGTLSPQVFVAPIAGTFLEPVTLAAGLPGLFFDQEYGLFFYAPFYILALPGAWWFCKDRRTRSEGIFLLLIYLVYHGIGAAYEMWYGSFSPVPRYLIPMLPILILWSTHAFATYWQRGIWLRLLLLVVLQSTITLLILNNRMHMFGFELGSNSLLREVFHAEHVIAWLPTFTQGNLPAAYTQTALLIVVLVLFLLPRSTPRAA